MKKMAEVVFIIDKSGSMSGLESDTIGGFNSLLEKQKNENSDAFLSTVFFNDSSTVVLDRVDISNVRKLTREDYICMGCTALLDAIGDSIKHIKNIHKYARKEDVPEKTLFVIITDGMENSSRRYRYKEIKELIEKMKKENDWEFLFLGANIDAIKEARNIGISDDYAVEFLCDNKGIELNYDAVSDEMYQFIMKRDRKISKDWKDNIEKDVKNRKDKNRK